MKRLFFLLSISALVLSAFAQAPAFPGAEGSGRYVSGGRGGQIIHVTNLNDSGKGSLRAALETKGKKTIVFDVGGVIPLKSDLEINSNTSILGQTAPYPGITIRYYTTRIKGDNVIVRFMRFRRGQERNVNDGADTFWGNHNTGIIIDHCSMSWSIDEIGSFYDNNNFTLQWCIYGESLNNAGHHKGAHGYGGIWGGKLASFHHNMIAHTNNRAPRFNGARYNWQGYKKNAQYKIYKWQNAVQAENVDFRNNVIFDWGGGGCYGGPGGGYINIVNNYYKATRETSHKDRVTLIDYSNEGNSQEHNAFYGMSSLYYINGNYVYGYGKDYDWKGVRYETDSTNSIIRLKSEDRRLNTEDQTYSRDSLNAYGNGIPHYIINGGKYVKIKLDKEVMAPVGTVTTHIATKAYSHVLSYAGASLYRDDVDTRYVRECANGESTYTGSVTGVKGRIDIVADCDGYNEDNFPFGSRKKNFDSDGDGMPDVWEKANGLNPKDPSDANEYTLDSKRYYTNLEVYANSLVEFMIGEQNRDAAKKVDEYFPPCKAVDGLDYYSGRKVLRTDISKKTKDLKLKTHDNYYVAKPDDANSILAIFDAIQSSVDGRQSSAFGRRSSGDRRPKTEGRRPIIFLPNGTYDFGKMTEIPLSCDNIAIIGESKDSTILLTTPDVEQEGLGTADMFYNTHDNVYFQNLTLKNDLGYFKAGGAGRAAVIQDRGNRTIYNNVRMLSHQDTYYSQNNGMQSYFKNCDIHGTVDFICGGGDVRFDSCTIVLEPRSEDGSGSRIITAPQTQTNYGYVFDNCKIVDLSQSKGEWRFGRMWNHAPICVFLNTTLDNNALQSLVKERWTPKGMHVTDPKEIGEYGTKNEKGEIITPGSNIIKMDNGEHNTILSREQVERFSYEQMFSDWDPRQICRDMESKKVRVYKIKAHN